MYRKELLCPQRSSLARLKNWVNRALEADRTSGMEPGLARWETEVQFKGFCRVHVVSG